MAEKNSFSRTTSESLVKIRERVKWNSSTPLILAVQAARIDVIKKILDVSSENINAQDSIGNTAVMAAAESGCDEAVQLLIERGANVLIKNSYEQTAIMLAAERDHVNIVEMIAKKFPGELLQINKYEKNVLFIACEFGMTNTALWVIENQSAETFDVNAVTKKNKTSALHFAAKRSEKIVARLLNCTDVDCNIQTTWGDTPLIWAAIGGNLINVKLLVEHGAHVNHKSQKGFTALRKAAEEGHIEIVKYLLANGAKSRNEARLDALKQGRVHAAHLFFKPDDEFSEVFSIDWQNTMADLGRLYASDSDKFRDGLMTIMKYAAYNDGASGDRDFYLEFLMMLIPKLHRKPPNTVLNEVLPVFYQALYDRCRGDGYDVDLVRVLVDLATILPKVKNKHPLEILELNKRLNVIMAMLKECVENSKCFNDNSKIKEILCYRSLGETVTDLNGTKHAVTYTNELVNRGQAFRGGLLETSIRGEVRSVFCSSHIGAYVDNLFWGFLRHRREIFGNKREIKQEVSRMLVFNGRKTCVDFSAFSEESRRIRCFQSNFIFARFCPAFIFIGEGISKLVMTALVSSIALLRSQEAFSGASSPSWILAVEYFTVILVFATVLYEYGELCDHGLSLVPSLKGTIKYFFDIWNLCDSGGLVLLLGWIGLRFHEGADSKPAVALVALSTIFSSVALLRYFSLFSPIGKLVSLTFVMMQDLSKFVVVLAFPMFGYTIALYSLFGGLGGSFDSMQQTLLTLFSAMFSNYDSSFTDTFGNSGSYSGVGIFLEISYIVFSALVIMNLIIAQMTRSHDTVNEKAFQYLQLEFAKTTNQFMLIDERNPFCMLPPPLNFLPSLLAILHFVNFRYGMDMARKPMRKLSIAGTFSDILVGIIGCFLAPPLEFISYFSRLTDRGQKLLEIAVMLFFCTVLYPLYVASLLKDLYNTGFTYVSIAQDVASSTAFSFVQFETKAHRHQLIGSVKEDRVTEANSACHHHRNSTVDMVIKLLRIVDLQQCANPVVKFRVGPLEVLSGPSLYGGSDPQWTHEELHLPLEQLMGDIVDNKYTCLDIEVVDLNSISGKETTVAVYEHDGSDLLLEWMGNRRFEGEIKLTGGKNGQEATLFVAIKFDMTFDDFLFEDDPDCLSPWTSAENNADSVEVELNSIAATVSSPRKASAASAKVFPLNQSAQSDNDSSGLDARSPGPISDGSANMPKSSQRDRQCGSRLTETHQTDKLKNKKFMQEKMFTDEELAQIFRHALGDAVDRNSKSDGHATVNSLQAGEASEVEAVATSMQVEPLAQSQPVSAAGAAAAASPTIRFIGAISRPNRRMYAILVSGCLPWRL